MMLLPLVLSLLLLLLPPSLTGATKTHRWKYLNNPIVKETSPDSLSITTPPATDLWRPTLDPQNFTAPYVYRVCPSANFKRVDVTLSADFKTRYDQGGIAIFFPERKGEKLKNGPEQWLKTGIEFENDAPQLGTVGNYRFSDWSLAPVVPEGAKEGRFLVERNGTELWAYHIVNNERHPLRELTWAFLEERGERDAEIWVGLYAAKPTYSIGNPREELTVEFKELSIEC